MSDCSDYMSDYWRRVADDYSGSDEDLSEELTWVDYMRFCCDLEVLGEEERPLFEFDPFSDCECFQFNLDSEQWVYTPLGENCHYHALRELTEKVSELLEAWEKRSIDQYGTRKLASGGGEELLKNKQLIDEIDNFVKENMDDEGGTAKEIEKIDMKMEQMHRAMASLFLHIREIVFDTVYRDDSSDSPMSEKRALLEEKFDVLKITVMNTELQISFQGLEIE